MIAASPWFVPLRKPAPAPRRAAPALRLYAIPYAGGSANVYRNWPAWLDPRIEVFGVQLPGRGPRLGEAPIADVERLLGDLLPALTAHAGGARFALFGHSLGALLAFELAQRLQARGAARPELVFVSGRAAPRTAHAPVARRCSSDADFVAELRHLQGTPREVLDNAELLALLMPTIRADFVLLHSWQQGAQSATPLDVPLVALAGRSDAHVALAAVDAWSDCTLSRFERLDYPCGHFFIHDDERAVVRDVGERLLETLVAA